MITIQNADKALKDYYLAAVSAQLNDGVSPFFAAIEKNANNVFGKEVKMTVVRDTCASVSAGTEDGDLPDPYSNRYFAITAPLKNIYGTIEISDKALRASRDASGAFVNLLNAETEGLINSAKQNFQRMLYGAGDGLLFKFGESESTTVYSVTPAKEYFTGMKVDCYDSSDRLTDEGLGVTVTGVDRDNGKATFSVALVDSPANGSAYVHGARGNELTGLGAIFGDGDLYGYTRESDAFLRPRKVDCGGEITLELILELLDDLEESYNSKVNMMLCSYKTRRAIASTLADRHVVLNTIDTNTGLGDVTINNIPVYADRYCPEDTIYLLNTDDFILNQLCDWEWLEDEDGKILKQVPGKAAYTATIVKYAELICKKPCGQGMLYNLGC